MNAKWQLLGTCLFVSLLGEGQAAPSPYSAAPARSTPVSVEDAQTLVRQFKTALADLKHEVNNHETEIRVFENRLHNQESSFDHLKQQVSDEFQSQRNAWRSAHAGVETKIEMLGQSVQNLETLMRGVMADTRQLQAQANESINVLGQYKQKIEELETLLDLQSQHMQRFEEALRSMLELVQAKEASKAAPAAKVSDDGSKTHKVQSGDSLEKIARHYKVSIQALRDANNLTSDRILIGQNLKIP